MIAILAILAGILLPALQQARARGTKCVANLKRLFGIGTLYINGHRNFRRLPAAGRIRRRS